MLTKLACVCNTHLRAIEGLEVLKNTGALLLLKERAVRFL
jgi:hypothetical protein